MRMIMGLDRPTSGDVWVKLWIRNLLQDLAAEGRTVLIFSHLMSEMALTATDLVVIGRGRSLSAGSIEDLIGRSSNRSVVVRSPQASHVLALLSGDGVTITTSELGVLDVRGLDAAEIGEGVASAGLVLHELAPKEASLEEPFMELTHGAVEYGSTTTLTTAGSNR